MIDAITLHLIWALVAFVVLFPGAFLAWGAWVLLIFWSRWPMR